MIKDFDRLYVLLHEYFIFNDVRLQNELDILFEQFERHKDDLQYFYKYINAFISYSEFKIVERDILTLLSDFR